MMIMMMSLVKECELVDGDCRFQSAWLVPLTGSWQYS
jgi:hypothetical protein